MEWEDPIRYEQMRRDTKAAIARLQTELGHEKYFEGWHPSIFESKLTDYDKKLLSDLKISLA